VDITEEELDIGGSLKPSAQCRRAARTAQTVLGQLTRGIHYRDRQCWAKLLLKVTIISYR
jgi:hypothetical protein